MLRIRELRPLLIVAGFGVVAAIAQTAGVDAGWLHLAPVLALLLPLFMGRYLGEEQIARLAAGRRQHPRIARSLVAASLPRTRSLVPRHGLLLAGATAKRGPPVVG